MKKTLLFSTLLIGSLIAGCASHQISNFDTFHADNLNELVSSGHLIQKTDNFFVINDSSSSMSETFYGIGYNGEPRPSKFAVETEILNRFNQTIPNINLNSGIRSFGFGPCTSWSYTTLNQPIGVYSKSGFGQGIDSLTCSGGGTPMKAALDAAITDLSPVSGNTALIILSDGKSQNTAVLPARELKKQLGDKLCIYTIWVGNKADEQGKILMQQLSDLSGCGFSTSAENIAESNGMSDFVKRVFFNAGHPVIDGDDDQDGVPNSKDRCPNTPRGATVDMHGCWTIHGIHFDVDKAVIKPQFMPLLDDAASILQKNPGLTVEIQGHTDSTGPDAYNMRLSERRARAVRDYLVNKTGKPEALTSHGYGESRPIDTNDTPEGRYNNRRVQLKIQD